MLDAIVIRENTSQIAHFNKFINVALNNGLAPQENPGSATEKSHCRVKPMFTGRLPSTMQHRRTPVGACLIIIDDHRSLAGIDPA